MVHPVGVHTQQVVRRPAVAGYFYPADPAGLREQVEACGGDGSLRTPATSVVVPHGSYRQCGAVLGQTLSRVVIPPCCVIVGPSHTGAWMRWRVMERGAYRTPLGEVPIDEPCAAALRMRCPFLLADAGSQRGEHAIEVILPFLQRWGPVDLRVVPVIVGSADAEEVTLFARALAQVARMREAPTLLIASSDLSHYEPRQRAVAHDEALLEAILALDGAALLGRIEERALLMCGMWAVVAVLEAARALGATQGSLVRYGTSAEAGGDPDAVIGYAGVIVR